MDKQWTYNHFGRFGLDAENEAIPFYMDGETIVYEVNDESVTFDGTEQFARHAGTLVVDLANAKYTEADIMDAIKTADEAFPQRGADHYKKIVELLSSVADQVTARAIAYQLYGADDFEGFCLWMTIAMNQAKSCVDRQRLDMEMPAHFDAYIGESTKTGKTLISYIAYGIVDLVTFEAYQVLHSGVRINRCALCGKAFIPAKRSDEMYCQNPYRNGKSCSEVAFDVKSQQDPFYTAYRTAYKTMSARVGRMIGKQNGKAKLEQWRAEAKEMLAKYRKADDLDSFKQWIANSKK